jgi:hypothetical protein
MDVCMNMRWGYELGYMKYRYDFKLHDGYLSNFEYTA